MGFVNPGHYRAVAVIAGEGESPLRYVYTREHRYSKTGGGCERDEMTADSNEEDDGKIRVKRKKKGRILFVGNALPGFISCHDLCHPEDAEGFKLGLMEQWGNFGKICSVELGGGGAEKENNSVLRHHHRISLDHGQTIIPQTIFARITFTSNSSLRSALAATTVKALPSELKYQQQQQSDDAAGEAGRGGGNHRPGLARSLEMHISARKDPSELSHEANIWMEAFDRAEMEAKRKRDAQAREPDEDGFITVNYKKKRGRQRPEEWTDAKMEQQQQNQQYHKRKKKKDLILTNFYRHQIREAKRDQLAELRRKFEADKEKVQKMKFSRQFKPF